MNYWLIIFLCMSLALNFLLFYAWQSKDKDFREVQEAFKDYKKLHESIEKLAKKHAKLFGGGK